MKKTLLISLFLFNTFYTFSQKNETVPDKYEVYKKMLEKQPYHKLLTGNPEEQPKLADWQKRVEFERLKTLDPATGEIPAGAMDKARESVEKSLQKAKSERKAAGIPNVKWKEVGPTNVGGRTRGIMYDPNDPTRSKVWSGGVSGGLWYNDNIRDANSGWNKVDDFWENMSVSCLAFDPTNPKIFYVGTGEIAGGVVQEVGYMWKSEDAGKTWKKLPNKPPGAFYMYRIVINKSGEVFVATGAGIQKSSDGGITWKTVLNASAGGTTDIEMASDEIIYVANNSGKIYRSNDVSGNQWTEITPPVNTVGNRTELGLALSSQGDKQVIYAYNNLNWMQKSSNAGKTWDTIATPVDSYGSPFVGEQGRYDLVITVHPTNPNIVYVGGTRIGKSTDGGKTWVVYEYRFIHPDHHNIFFNDKNNDEVIFSCDGGVYYSADAGQNLGNRPKIEERNKNYNTSQFYSVAIRNIQNDETIIGGAQDNGSWKVNGSVADLAKEIGDSGDGTFCFIDEDNSDLIIGSTQYGAFYSVDRNNLNYRSLSGTLFGSFINPADYNSKTNVLFSNANSTTKINRINLNKNTNAVDVLELGTNIGAAPSAFKTTPNNSLFLGTYSGKVFKVTGVDNSVGNTQDISTPQLPNSYIGCIDVGVNENELLVIYSNYNVSSVWYTNDGGKNWINKDIDGYGLPNIPVKWGIFNPNNRKQVMLATDLGVWSTNDITATNPAWEISNSGLALVRCDMIKCRASDGYVAVATHGRGFFSSYAFAPESNSTTKKISTSFPVEEKKLCAGNKLTVSFNTSGSFVANEEYKVFLSDGTGNFATERLIGQGTQSPIICNLPIPKLTTNTSELPNLISGTNYKYRIEASKSLISSSSSESISIASPQSKIVGTVNYICQGSSTTLQSSVVNNNFFYEWSRDGNKILNQNSNKLIVKETGSYSLKISEQNCNTTSNTYNIDVRQKQYSPSLDIPTFSTARTDICEGFTIFANTTADKPDYQLNWQKDGVNIPNATKKDLTIESSGVYRIVYTQGDCQSISNSVNINISKNIPIKIATFLGGDVPICRGTKQLYYLSGYKGELKFQWQMDGKDIPNATESYYETYNEGTYTLRASQGKCVATSQPITTKYTDEIKMDISTQDNVTKMCKGGLVTLITTNYQPPSGPASFYWKRNGVEIGKSDFYKFQVSESGDYSVSVRQGNCIANSSNSIKIQIDTTNSLSLKLVTSGGREICEGSSGSISLPNREIYPNDIQYSWQKDGINIPGQTTYPNFSPYESGSYTLTAQKNGCKGISDPVIIKVGQTISTPLLVEYTQSGISRPTGKEITLCDGQLMFITPQFIPELNYGMWYNGTYQWQKDGKDIPNATASSYALKESGNYAVILKDKNCTVTSQPLKVNYTSVPPDITPNSSRSICDKGVTPITFKTTSNDNDLAYQWKANGTNLVGETKNTLTTSKEGDYQLIVNRGLCSSASEVVNIKKSSTPKTTISTDATNPILCDGETVTLKADKQDGINYRWFLNSSAVAGVTSKSLKVNLDGKYSVEIDDGNCIYQSDTVEINFLKVPNKFTTTNTEQFFCENSSLTLSSAASADTSIKYQWKLNNVNIPNANKSALSVSKEGNYQFIATIGRCSSTSEEVKVKMVFLPKATISSDYNPIACTGQIIKLSANKEAGLMYQWLKDGKKINSAVSDTLRVLEDGKYSVITDNGKCQSTSDVKNISFIKLPSQISPAALEQSFCEKSFLILSAITNTDTSVKYQWKRNNENISLATANSLKISQEGNYQFVATKSGCFVISSTINVKQTLLPKSEITTTNDLTTLCVGDIVVLNGNKEDGITYQWKKDSINIDKTNAPNLGVSKSGKYTLITSRNDCPTTSNSVNIFFNDKPTASISGGTTLYLSESSTLKIDLTSLAPWTIKISDGKEYTANSTPYSVNVTPLDTNAYTITSVVNRCGTGVSKGVVKFKILAPLANEPTLLNEPVLLASSPNPFHETCTIKYGLPKLSDVKLILYDNQGKEKSILVDEKKASGWHTQNLSSKSLTVGSYILRLEVNGQVFSQKIMLVTE